MNNTKPLTIDLLHDTYNFDVTDMGDFWVARRQCIQLIQPKMIIPFIENLPFYVIAHTNNKIVNITISTNHELHQLSRYYDLKLFLAINQIQCPAS